MQIKTYLHRYRVSSCIIFFRFIQRNTCAQLYVCTIRLYPLSTLCFCINYANEGYLHRGRVSFRLTSVIITRHTHANLKIAKKNTAVMIDFFENLLLYARMSNLCKLCIYLHNFVMIHFPTSN